MPEYRLVWHRDQWSIAWTEPGSGRKRRATGQVERGKAEAVAGEIWLALNAPQSERVEDLWPIYAADRKATVAKPSQFDSVWKALKPHFGYKIADGITREDCKAYIAARSRQGKTPSTIRTELELLRACLRYHYGANAPALTLPSPSPPRDRWLTKDEARVFLDSIETPHVRLFVEIALATGARQGGILDLTWDRVNFREETIDFRPVGREQTNKRRVEVKMTPRVRDALQEAHRAALSDYVIEYGGKPVGSVKTALKAASRRSGVQATAHVFRHTAAVWMAMDDVPMAKIAAVLGHTSSRVTETVYARYSPRFMADAMKALDW